MFRHWKILYLKPNSERKVAEICRREGIAHYLPITTATRIYQRRKEVVHFPIFRGYLFASIKPDDMQTLYRTNMLVRIIKPMRPYQLLKELVIVRRTIKVANAPKAEPKYKIGQKVKVIMGPFRGQEAMIERVNNELRLILTFEMIGQQISAAISSEEIEIIQEDSPTSTLICDSSTSQ